MKRFTLVNRGDQFSRESCQSIKHKLIELGMIYDEINPELVITVGGDGTLLHAFHHYLDRIDEVAFIGIHTGTLGFSTDYIVDELECFYHDLIHNEHIFEEKSIIEATCYKNDDPMTLYALNEVRVENIVKTQPIDVYLNNEYFEMFRGNGLCISGQYGSTAYNRSIGGAVIYHGLELLQMTEISGIHHRHARSLGSPLILAPDTEIKLEYENFDHALLCYDHLHIHLDDINKIIIRHTDKKAKFLHLREYSYIDKLNALF